MNKDEIIQLLTADGEEQQMLYDTAKGVRDKQFPEGVSIRGVVEVCNLCLCNCDYCPMRRDNLKNNSLFTLNEVGILGAVEQMTDCGIRTVFLQGGENPANTRIAGGAIRKIRSMYRDEVNIILNLGVKTAAEYAYLFEQGANGYILKFETSDHINHERLRHEALDKRIEAIQMLLETGYEVGTGMIIGLPGQTIDSIADDILLAKSLNVHMCSVSPFLPAPHTPLEHYSSGSIDLSLNAISIMRILQPEWLIPSVSALEKVRAGGQIAGLNAGANVITVNYTPKQESGKYHIYGENRFVVTLGHALQTIAGAGLQAAADLRKPAAGPNAISKETNHESISS
ncbi:biotin synthase BioB [Paenibacillus sp. FSL R7-0331]|uniref:biotin synthase BioB n=1 Tax=Paenibacillus sp. FSL R7-0331 TaxID=1536773 RepID=UPI00069397F3|nr:radical SAM protein [Paenibacillus sp. FSL R7-0331]